MRSALMRVLALAGGAALIPATVALAVHAAAGTAGCAQTTQGGPWQDTAFAAQSGSFTVQFDATPSAGGMNGVIGLSNGAQTAYTGFAAIARFNPSGDIDARNGGSYAAASTIPYQAGVTYHFRMAVDVPTHRYSTFVTAPGGAEQTVGSGFAFRTEQSTVSQLNWWGAYSEVGSEQVCSFALTVAPTPTPTPTPVCAQTTQGGPWQDTAFAAQSGSFTVQFDATPSAGGMNGVIGLSNGAQTAYTGFAAIARFNPSGDIDARNGGSYAAASTIPYQAGVTYHFRMAVDVPTQRYSTFVTAPGGAEQTVGSGFAFRTEQSTVSQLNWWGAYSEVGSERVCSFALTLTPTPTPTPTGTPTPTPTPTGTPTPTPTPTGTPTPTPSPSGGCAHAGPVPGLPPGCNFDLSIWELQLPIGSPGNPTTISNKQLEAGFTDPYFFTGSDGSMDFYDPGVNCVTTPNSTHCRSELREVNTDGSPAVWSASGTNTLSATLTVTNAAGAPVIGQIHDDPAVSVRPLIELFYTPTGDIQAGVEQCLAGGCIVRTTVGHVAPGTKFSYVIDYSRGVLTVSINGGPAQSLSSPILGVGGYFKAGDYGQSPTAASVSFYALEVTHGS